MKRIHKVAILGAGTMGARIAAHFANAGVPSYLLDIVPPDADAPARNKIAAAGLDAAKKSKPAAFMDASLARLVTVGNFEDDLSRVAEADWIIEVVSENLEIKRNLLQRVAQSINAIAAATMPPAVAAITLGLVKQRGYAHQLGRNEAFNHAGNVTESRR